MVNQKNNLVFLNLDLYKQVKSSFFEFFILNVKLLGKGLLSTYVYGISFLGKGAMKIPRLLSCVSVGYLVAFLNTGMANSDLFKRFFKNFQNWVLTLGFGYSNVLLLNHSNLAMRLLDDYLLVRFGSNRELVVIVEARGLLIEIISEINKQFIRYNSYEKALVENSLVETYVLYPANPYTGKGLIAEVSLPNFKLKSGKRSKV